ncbi:MAG: hypothetical protein HFJ07_00555 [Lachnospiraceae bacterium]|nr:hypothetical protein [Lachnospiraceae bacterium]
MNKEIGQETCAEYLFQKELAENTKRVYIRQAELFLEFMGGWQKPCQHSFRHLFAITYLRQYSDLSEPADILGHSSLKNKNI